MHRRWFVLAVLLLAAPTSAQQDSLLCNASPLGPFVVTSGAPFTVGWLMTDTVTENNITVPNRYDGFYLQIDGGPTIDIGLATALPPCSATSSRPGDKPYNYVTPQGVSRGAHTLKINAWNYELDSAGNPTQTRQVGVVASVPFTAGDPILFGPPGAPMSVVVVPGTKPVVSFDKKPGK